MAKQKQKYFFAKKIMIYMFIFIIVACNIHTYNTNNKHYGIMCETAGTIDINTIKIDYGIINILSRYINKNPQYNTFAIIELPIEKFAKKNKTGIFIGPGYKALYDDIYPEKVLDTINIKNVRIYIISSKPQHITIKDNWENTNPKDSITLGVYKKRVSYYTEDNFLWRALYVYKNDKEYKTINRLDTVMFVKEVPPSIQYSNPWLKNKILKK